MTPETKANELVDKFRTHAYPPEDLINDDEEEYFRSETRIAKQCAIIACDFAMEVMMENLVPIEIDDIKAEIEKI